MGSISIPRCMSVYRSVIAAYPTKLLGLLLHPGGARESDAGHEGPFPSQKRTDMAGLVRGSRLPVRPGTLEGTITDERLERIVRALWSSVGAVALIVLLASPPGVQDTTSTSDVTNAEGSAPLPHEQPGFLSSAGISRKRAVRDETAARGGSRASAPQFRTEGIPREFYFSRVAYRGYGGYYGRGRSWATDYPRADQIFLSFIDRLLPNLDAFEQEFVVTLAEPELRSYPFLYALEVGRMSLSPEEIEGLRSYLLQGGFLVIDDFWGTREWQNFEYEIRQVLPEYDIVDLAIDHPIFTTFYEIEEIIQVPNVNQGVYGGPTHERDGYVPMVKGIHDENGRLMVVINWNTDLGDAWEWADNPRYPLRYSTYAYEMGVNFIVYAMSH